MTQDAQHWARQDPMGLWRRWLMASRTDAQALRRWQVWVWWSRPRPPLQRVRLVGNQLLQPLFRARDAVRAIRQHGAEVAASHGISRARQFWEIVRFHVRSGLPAMHYYRFRLFLPERRGRAGDFTDQVGPLVQVLVHRKADLEEWYMLRDKVRFSAWCEKRGIASIPTFMHIDGTRIKRVGDHALPPVDIFMKPIDWRQGKGIERFEHSVVEGRSHWAAGDGRRMSQNELEAHAVAQSLRNERTMILQPRLVNHHALETLGNGALCTLRMMTVQPAEGNPELLVGLLRIGTGKSVADNFHLGGLAAPVDTASGKLQKAIAKLGTRLEPLTSTHPETGSPIEGTVVPYWKDAVDLVLRAHGELSLHLPLIGWDVAILEDGPIMVEANLLADTEIAQKPTGVPLGASRLARIIREALEAEFVARGS